MMQLSHNQLFSYEHLHIIMYVYAYDGLVSILEKIISPDSSVCYNRNSACTVKA